MKTMRRAIATAAIGVMAAGVIGLAAPAASAAPVSAGSVSASASCYDYKEMAKKYYKIAENSSGAKAAAAQKKADQYMMKYKACIS